MMQACCVPGTDFLPPLTGKAKIVKEVIIRYELTFSGLCEVRNLGLSFTPSFSPHSFTP